MSAAACETPQTVTLLELVQAVLDSTDDEREAVAAVLSMLRSGRIRLGGNFRDCPLDALR